MDIIFIPSNVSISLGAKKREVDEGMQSSKKEIAGYWDCDVLAHLEKKKREKTKNSKICNCHIFLQPGKKKQNDTLFPTHTNIKGGVKAGRRARWCCVGLQAGVGTLTWRVLLPTVAIFCSYTLFLFF